MDKKDRKGNQKLFMFITYGCQMNENDAERLAGLLMENGYARTEEPAAADLILLNTCCVRESAENKIYGKIGELKRLKTVRPDLVIGVAGCMAQKEKEALFQRAPHIDFVLGTHNLHDLVEIVEEVRAGRRHVLAVREEADGVMPDAPAARRGTISAWMPIMYGCNNFCTYCIVPYVRGRERSRPLADIAAEANDLGRRGFKEITLLGQNVNSYGKDTKAHTFADLLRAVDAADGIERVRYMTSHPRDMGDDVIAAVREGLHICEHFHLPVQAGSDEILEAMNRGYTTAYYRDLAAKIRRAIPGATLTTDLIVGFPGETDELFEETLAFVKRIRYDAAYTFLYSRRSGTPAAMMGDQVETAVKKARLQRLMDAQNAISLEINRSYEGRTVEVMIEGPSKNDERMWTGRTRGNKLVLWEKRGGETPGRLAGVRVLTAQTWLLKGALV